MLHVLILVHEDVILSSAAGPLDILTRTNDLLLDAGREPRFRVELVTEKYKNIHLQSPAQFVCQRSIAELDTAAPEDSPTNRLIIVPAFSQPWEKVRDKNRAVLHWLAEQHHQGAEIASLCVGCYFLAETGLLEGKSCTSHWRAAADLQQRFPNIRVTADAVLTEQDGIYTGGGAFSSLNLIVYLVEKFCGLDTAIAVSKNFSIHLDHHSQAHFSAFSGQRRHGDSTILKIQDYIEQHYRENLKVEQLAETANMSKRNFVRRFKQVTHNTPIEYVQRVKIEAAKKALESSAQTLVQVMLGVGYNDSKTFRDVFKRMTGLTPQAYRNKYRRSG